MSTMKHLAFATMLACAVLPSCSSDDTDNAVDPIAGTGPLYVLSTLFPVPEGGHVSYVNFLGSLGPQVVDHRKAREYSGTADTWEYDGALYLSDGETATVTKYSVANGKLEEVGKIDFGAHGFSDLGLWNNDFVSPTKAYMFNFKAREWVIWNPTTLKVIDKLALPPIADRPGYMLEFGLADRSTELRGGRLYLPIYWSNTDYTKFAPDSLIVVVDVERNAIADTLSVPCPDLDYGTQDEAGNLYFSSWESAPMAAIGNESPKTCVAKIAAGSEQLTKAFDFASIAGGREGAALKSIGNGKMLFAAYHHERLATPAEANDRAPNFRIWSYDINSGASSELTAIDWNTGGYYAFNADGKRYVLTPHAKYQGSDVYDVTNLDQPQLLFKTHGWSIRLFKIR